jgi:hypothetical protein
MAIDNPKNQGCTDRSIDGIPTATQNPHRALGGQRVDRGGSLVECQSLLTHSAID